MSGPRPGVGIPSSPKNRMSRKIEYGKIKFRLIKSQVRGSYAREKVNEHFSIVSGDCTLHDDSYGCFAVANASIDREIWTNKGDLARVTKYGNILMVFVGYRDDEQLRVVIYDVVCRRYQNCGSVH